MWRWVIVLAAGLVSLGYPATIHVPADQPTIQAGIDAASDGDTVLVQPGTYSGPGNTGLRSEAAIHLLSQHGSDSTTIEAAGDSVFILDHEMYDRVQGLSGFTVRNAAVGVMVVNMGNLARISDMRLEGSTEYGIYCTSSELLDIDSCHFSGNRVGFYSQYDLRINDCTFDGDSVGLAGAGALDNCTLVNCDYGIVGHRYFELGAPRWLTLQNCLLKSNSEAAIARGWRIDVFESEICNNGAVIDVDQCRHPQIILTNCLIRDNTGGITFVADHPEEYAELTMINCQYIGNGSIAYDASPQQAIIFELEGCLFARNTASALSVAARFLAMPYDRHSFISGCTFVQNAGSAFEMDLEFATEDQLSIDGSTFAFNAGYGLSVQDPVDHIALTCNDVYGNLLGDYNGLAAATGSDGNLSEDPRFCDTATGDYSLASNSPCLATNNPCSQLIGALGEGCAPVYHTWWVATDGSDLTGDGSESSPFATIQRGIDASVNGDTIMVRSGTYGGPGNWGANFNGKSIVLASELGPGVTTLQSPESSTEQLPSGLRLVSGENSSTRIQGFTFKMFSPSIWRTSQGGAILCNGSSPTVANCLFVDCGADIGGSIYLENANATIDGCEFNAAMYLTWTANAGGGVYSVNSAPTIRNCQFNDLGALSSGGAIYLSSSDATFEDCLLYGNLAGCGPCKSGNVDNPIWMGSNADSLGALGLIPLSGKGGAISGYTSSLRALKCNFVGNSVDEGDGGAIWVDDNSSLALDSCTFDGNSVSGMETRSGGAVQGPGTFTACVFSENKNYTGGMGGAYAGTGTFTNCQFIDNHLLYGSGGAVYGGGVFQDCLFEGNEASISWSYGGAFYGTATFSECTFVANGAPHAGTIFSTDPTTVLDRCIITSSRYVDYEPWLPNTPWIDGCATLTCCDVYGNEGGDWVGCIANQKDLNNNLWTDPRFCDTANGNYSLAANSPCLAANSPCGQLIGAFDVGCSCCIARVGDSNGEGEYPDEVTLGDIMLMVDVKFISGDCSKLLCVAEADVNQDGGAAPTCEDHVTLGDIMALVDFLFISNTPLKECL